MSTLSDIKKVMKKESFNANKGGSAITYFLKRHPEIIKFLDAFMIQFPCFEKHSEVLSWLQNKMKIVKCLNCGKRLTYTNSRKGGSVSCSKECSKSEICRKHKNSLRLASMEANGKVNPFATEAVKAKIKATNLKKYGVENPMQNKEISARATATLMQQNLTARNLKRGFNALNQRLETANLSLITNFDEYIGITNGTVYKFRCNKCGKEFNYKWNNSKNLNVACPSCFPYYRSRGESELAAFIRTICECNVNDRILLKGYHNPELDIYIPSKKLAIEYNGLYWHSESQGKDRRYHLDKTLACQEHGVQLIHIFSDEWENKQQIVKARLRHILGATKYKIQARKCNVDIVDNKMATKFLNKYHIQGAVNASINLGLFYKNRFVALMTFGKSRFNKSYDYELLRYCTIANFSIIGAAGKLFNYFLKNYSGSIISYADRRWSNGNLYKQLGFEELSTSAPAYYYIKDDIRYNRVKFQKHKLANLLEAFDPTLSESENMSINGYIKVWDCGNLCYGFNQN